MAMLSPGFGRFGLDPFMEMRRLQNEMNRMFSGVGAAETFPPINLWIGEDSVVVTAELPGYAPENVDLTVQEDVLTISARRDAEAEMQGQGAAVHRRERFHGRFARTVQLPFRVDPDRVDARFNNGILEVELHRPDEDRPRKIQIRAS